MSAETYKRKRKARVIFGEAASSDDIHDSEMDAPREMSRPKQQKKPRKGGSAGTSTKNNGAKVTKKKPAGTSHQDEDDGLPRNEVKVDESDENGGTSMRRSNAISRGSSQEPQESAPSGQQSEPDNESDGETSADDQVTPTPLVTANGTASFPFRSQCPLSTD